MLADIYKRVCKNSPAISRMNFINAEITKLAVNTYITTKISYANMLARLCEKLPEADANVVTDALGLDTRIGPKYLKGAVELWRAVLSSRQPRPGGSSITRRSLVRSGRSYRSFQSRANKIHCRHRKDALLRPGFRRYSRPHL